jgi:multidrug efflux pump subunit AcrA (membrane-fusion protein)
MDPTYVRDEPGLSPMGMELVPVYADDGSTAPSGTVSIDPVTIQNIGVRTALVERRTLKKSITTIGRIDYDEKRISEIHTKIDGWIEELYVNFTGKEVKADDILLEIYSPTLVSAQEEYVLALKHGKDITIAGKQSLAELSLKRLQRWDVPPHQIAELKESGNIMRTLHIHTPASGIVIEKHVTKGMYVKPGMSLYTIADISKVWVYADIYEYEIPLIRKGQLVEMRLEAYPGVVFKGRVAFIYPFMEDKTRTNKIRLEFENPHYKLKPDMYANVTINSIIGKALVAVPIEAVIRSGTRNIVVLDMGEGKFRPTEITLGQEAEGYYEVKDGLAEGERIVTSAHFLIDSESRLKEAIGKMLKEKSDDKTSSPADITGHNMANHDINEGSRDNNTTNHDMNEDSMSHDTTGHDMPMTESIKDPATQDVETPLHNTEHNH